MLQNIREKLSGRMAFIVLVVIALSFVFVGGASFTTIGQSFAAKVDGELISITAFENSYRDQLQANPQYATLPDTLRATLRRSILEQLIQQQVVDNYLDDAGYRVSTTELTRQVHAVPEFQTDGVFDEEVYASTIALQGRSVAEYERSIMQALRGRQLQYGIRGTSVVTPAAYRRFLNLAFEQRIVSSAELTTESVADEVEITEEMITTFYEDNPGLYQLPEMADVAYIEVARGEVTQNVSITEEQLQEYYEYNKDRYEQDEQRQARHILIAFEDDEDAAEALADELFGRIQAGESFESLAAEYSADSLTAPQGGDFGAMTEEQYPEGVGRAVFGMAAGEIGGPIRGDFGFHIVRLDRVLESGPLPYEQVRSALLVEMQEEQAEGLFLDAMRQLSDARFDAVELEGLAAATGLDIRSAEGFTRNGGAALGASPAVIDAVFAATVLAGDEMTDVVEIDADRAVVMSVTKHHPAVRQPLEEVRTTVEETLMRNRSEEIIASRAQQMLESVQAGEDFAAAAAVISAVVSEPASMRRNDAEADQSLKAAVFSAPKPGQDTISAGMTRNDAGGYSVYRIEAVMPGRPEAIPLQERDAGKLQLTDSLGVGDFVAFVQSLRDNADVIINEDALAAEDLFQ